MAYVFDNSGDFHEKVNRELVDLESLASDDISWLRETLAKHQLETGSTIAQQMLDGWPSINTKFVKVMPRHYKRVLLAIAEAEANGTDSTHAVMSVAEDK